MPEYFVNIPDSIYVVTLRNNAGQPIGYAVESTRDAAETAARLLYQDASTAGDSIGCVSIGATGYCKPVELDASKGEPR